MNQKDKKKHVAFPTTKAKKIQPLNQVKSNEVDLFSTLYGNEQNFQPKSQLTYIPKYVKYCEDASLSSRPVKNSFVPVNKHSLIKSDTNLPVKVVVPHSKPIQQSLPAPRKLPPTPSTNPKISNDHLFLFDDSGYDDPEFLCDIIAKIERKEKILAKSLYYENNSNSSDDNYSSQNNFSTNKKKVIQNTNNSAQNDNIVNSTDFSNLFNSSVVQNSDNLSKDSNNGYFEWRTCYVVGYNKPNFIIKFDINSDRTKEVPRVALKFDIENNTRFEGRRAYAITNRREIDAQLRFETYLYSRASRMKATLDPQTVRNIIEKVGFEAKNNTILNNLFIEIRDNYLYAQALGEFVREWEDPQSREKFVRNGLEKHNFNNKSGFPVDKLNFLQNVNSYIFLPNQIILQHIVFECQKYTSADFFDHLFHSFKPPLQLSYFIDNLKFETDTITADARFYLYKKLTELSRTLLVDIPFNKSGEKIEKMVNLRYKTALANIVNFILLNLVTYIKKFHITFEISNNQEMDSFKNSMEIVRKCGNEVMDSIYHIYERNTVLRINVYTKSEEETLNVSFDYVSESLKIAKREWHEFIEEDCILFTKEMNNILEMIKHIPENPEEAVFELFKEDDSENHLENRNNPKNLFERINLSYHYETMRKNLIAAKQSLNTFLLNYKDHMKLKLFDVDNTSFYKSILERYNKFYTLLFTKFEEKTNQQISGIGDIVKSFEIRSGKLSDSIDDWFNKHLLLLEVRDNIHYLEDELNSVSNIINFMSDFLYAPKLDFKDAYDVKRTLLNVYSNINTFEELDTKERDHFINDHSKNIEVLKKELDDFQVELMKFHFMESNETNYPLLTQQKNKFDLLSQKVALFQSYDMKLNIEKTTYDSMDYLSKEFDLILPIWTIGHLFETETEKWLSQSFRELDVNHVTSTLINWRKELEDKLNELSGQENNFSQNLFQEDDLLKPTIEANLVKINDLIQHLPVATALGNKHFRSRHWDQICQKTSMNIGPNEGLTWHWLIESGIEKDMLALESISRTADHEFSIETALQEMVEELQTMRLRVNEENGVLRLEDPTYAVEMLGKHQQEMQLIFIPPYVQPFLVRIRDYDVLATNLRQILKQTLDAQQKIDELKPAMDSNDIRTNHEEIAEKFDSQIQKFNEFTGSFKLSLSFHQIVNNQRYVELSADLSSNFNDIRDNLAEVLEEKRKVFPRFRLLSDLQLVYLISNCNKPSLTKNMFSLMYSSIKEIILENNEEKFCIGFISKNYGEIFLFEKKIKITHYSIEKWHLEFDHQIKETMKIMTYKVMQQATANLERILQNYPIQVVCLVHEIIFTSNVTKNFKQFESNFSQNRQYTLLDNFQNYLVSINKDISVFSNMLRKVKQLQLQYQNNDCTKSENDLKKSTNNENISNSGHIRNYNNHYFSKISSLILTFLNHRDTLVKMLSKKIDSSDDPIWFSKIKYFQKKEIGITSNEPSTINVNDNDNNIQNEKDALYNVNDYIRDFRVSVQIGPSSIDYGFEFTAMKTQFIQTSMLDKLFCNLMMSIQANSIVPLLCADCLAQKTSKIVEFSNSLGYQPFIFPCSVYSTFEKMQSAMLNAIECKEFLIFKGIDQLSDEALHMLNVHLFIEKKSHPIFATYNLFTKNYSTVVTEQLKLYYRPIYLNSVNIRKKYKLLIEALLIDNNEIGSLSNINENENVVSLMESSKNSSSIMSINMSMKDFIFDYKKEKTIYDLIAEKFAYLTETMSTLFEEPLNSFLMENFIIQFLQKHPVTTPDDLIKNFANLLKSKLVDYDITVLLESISNVFEDIVEFTDDEIFCDNKNNENMIKYDNFESVFSDKETDFIRTICSNFGVIILGSSMSGKTSLVKKIAEKLNKKISFINPLSLSLTDLFGSKNNGGLLSSTLIETLVSIKTDKNNFDGNEGIGKISAFVVFDSICSPDWMVPITYGIRSNDVSNTSHRLYFGDGSMFDLSDDFRFIFETDDIALATPAVMSVCTTFYIEDSTITNGERIENFLLKLGENESIIEKHSNMIVGSLVPASKLTEMVKYFFDFFIQKTINFIDDFIIYSTPSSKSNEVKNNVSFCLLSTSNIQAHFINNFFEYFECNLLNYYVHENGHSADDLLKDVPNMLLFSLIWAFGGLFDTENRVKIEDFLKTKIEEYSTMNINLINIYNNCKCDSNQVNLFDLFYDENEHIWKKWEEKEIPQNSMKVSPDSIFIPHPLMSSTLSLTTNLSKQCKNVLICGDNFERTTPFVDVCINSDIFLSDLSTSYFSLINNKTSVRKILSSLLPDPHITNGLTVRSPLLALVGIDSNPGNRNSELLRFLMEHHFFQNSKTFVNEACSSLRFIFTTNRNDINARFGHFCFVIRINKYDDISKQTVIFSNILENILKNKNRNLIVDHENCQKISSLLLTMLENIKSDFPFQFNLRSIYQIYQKVDSRYNSDNTHLKVDKDSEETDELTKNENDSKDILEIISIEAINVFYSSTHSEDVLAKINYTNRQLAKIFDCDPSNAYNPLTAIEYPYDNENNSEINETKNRDINNNEIKFAKIRNENLQNDVKSLTEVLLLYRSNVIIECDSITLPQKIVNISCKRNGFILYEKKLEDPLIKVFHDCFIQSGMTKKHSILFIDSDCINNSGKEKEKNI